MAKKEKSRFYSFKIVSYANRVEIQPLLDMSKHWVCILHDKDEADPHFHILATFHRELSFKLVRELVTSEHNTLTNQLDDWIGDFLYLTHKNAPSKYQYPESALESNDLDFWKTKADIQTPVSEYDFVDDLLSGKLTYRQMARRYGRDYIRNFKSYEEFRFAVASQEERILQSAQAWTVDADKAEMIGTLNENFILGDQLPLEVK